MSIVANMNGLIKFIVNNKGMSIYRADNKTWAFAEYISGAGTLWVRT